YQYTSRPMIERRSRYDNFFPSGSIKYRFTDSLDILAGYSKTIRRPTWNSITGIWAPNDTAGTVAVPNPGLLPENSDNISVRMAYYFEPVGIIAASVYENNIKNLIRSDRLTAEEYGYV